MFMSINLKRAKARARHKQSNHRGRGRCSCCGKKIGKSTYDLVVCSECKQINSRCEGGVVSGGLPSLGKKKP